MNGKKSETGQTDIFIKRRCDTLIQIYIFLFYTFIPNDREF